MQPADGEEVEVPEGDEPADDEPDDGPPDELVVVDPPVDDENAIEDDVAGAETEGAGAEVGALHAATASTPPVSITVLVTTIVGSCARVVTDRP